MLGTPPQSQNQKCWIFAFDPPARFAVVSGLKNAWNIHCNTFAVFHLFSVGFVVFYIPKCEQIYVRFWPIPPFQQLQKNQQLFSKYCEVCGVVRRSIVIPSLSNHSRLTPPRSLTRSNVTALSYTVTFKSQSGCFRGRGGLTAIFKEL